MKNTEKAADREHPAAAGLSLDEARNLEQAHLFGVYTTIRQPMVIERGEDEYLVDTEGRRYLDLVSGGRAVTTLGHCPQRVVRALCEQAAALIHVSNDFYTSPQLVLAKELTAQFSGSRVFFCNSGAEANEAAIKLARKHARARRLDNKFEIVTALDSFHGRTLAALTATGQPKYQKGFEPLVPGFAYVKFNDVEGLRAAVGERTCAVMLEPVLGEAGVFPATEEFMRTARECCERAGALLILDEVQTGMGRTGKMFAWQHYGVRPGIMTLAKGLGAGFPIGAMLADEKIASSFGPGDHASTFGGNPLACASALAALRMLIEERFVEKAADLGVHLARRLEEMGSLPIVSETRCIGLMAGISLARPSAGVVRETCRKAGVLIASVGDSILRILPPLTIQAGALDDGLRVVADALGQQA
jgi:predicted acetylornithine/succinylornithine family transaminase